MSEVAEALFDDLGLRVTGKTVERRRQRDRDDGRRTNLKRFYGLSLEDYEAMRAAQGYRCAICQRHEDELPQRKSGRPRLDGKPIAAATKLVVDHDHETGKIRGLLCGWCNSGIGSFQDRADWLSGAVAYVTAGGFYQDEVGS